MIFEGDAVICSSVTYGYVISMLPYIYDLLDNLFVIGLLLGFDDKDRDFIF